MHYLADLIVLYRHVDIETIDSWSLFCQARHCAIRRWQS